MSLVPEKRFTVILDKDMSANDCQAAYELICETKGVLQARFNEQAREVDVRYSTDPRAEIAEIDGVKDIRRAQHRL